jgi:hypothetical protein
MQGVELINRLLRDEPEQTIGIRYESTLDGRNAARHERSSLAGSGDPGKVQSRPSQTRPTRAWKGDTTSEPHISEEELGVTQQDAGSDDN